MTDIAEIRRKSEALRSGWAELEKIHDEQIAFLHYLAKTMDEHGAQTVGELPQHIQDNIMRRCAKLAHQSWVNEEQERLRRLAVELMLDFAPLTGPPS